MSRSTSISNTLAVLRADRAVSGSQQALAAGLLLALLAAYSLPWLNGPGAGLTFNAYDLAEWISLYPAARAESPALLTPLLLRLPLALIGLIAIVGFQRAWLRALVVVVTALALLPPLDFFTTSSADPNYRQQFMLSLAFVLGSMSTALLLRRVSPRVICAGVGVVSAGAALTGLLRAQQTIALTGIQTTLGPGGLLLAALFTLLAVYAVLIKQTRQSYETASW